MVRAALARLHDPYSRLISRSAFAGMLKYDVSGVGLNLVTGEEYLERTNAARLEDGRRPSAGVWVLGVIQGSLAEQAGVRLVSEGGACTVHGPTGSVWQWVCGRRTLWGR